MFSEQTVCIGKHTHNFCLNISVAFRTIFCSNKKLKHTYLRYRIGDCNTHCVLHIQEVNNKNTQSKPISICYLSIRLTGTHRMCNYNSDCLTECCVSILKNSKF